MKTKLLIWVMLFIAASAVEAVSPPEQLSTLGKQIKSDLKWGKAVWATTGKPVNKWCSMSEAVILKSKNTDRVTAIKCISDKDTHLNGDFVYATRHAPIDGSVYELYTCEEFMGFTSRDCWDKYEN